MSHDHDYSAPTWEIPCSFCHEPVSVNGAYLEHIGDYHTGCAGTPFCWCFPRHKGDCKPAVDKGDE